ncbi:hypothetical protein [Nonomuraea sediminis]|uniref:hypothetical protein n=1 Tax=Nonomuraea sediminis TaxID=2835864 RepID=UPI001BDD05E1|nr:hypothetical protein [Nonomuraea sediminis]
MHLLAAAALALALPVQTPAVSVAPLHFALGKLTVKGTYAKASDKRVNAALRAPIDARAKEYAANLSGSRATAYVDTTVKLNGPRYASVRYDMTIHSKVLWHPTWTRARTVTVDLRSGRALRGTDLFAPGVSMRKLTKLFTSSQPCFADIHLKRADLNGPGLQFALTGARLEVAVDGPYFSTATACGQQTIKIPYSKLPGFRLHP